MQEFQVLHLDVGLLQRGFEIEFLVLHRFSLFQQVVFLLHDLVHFNLVYAIHLRLPYLSLLQKLGPFVLNLPFDCLQLLGVDFIVLDLPALALLQKLLSFLLDLVHVTLLDVRLFDGPGLLLRKEPVSFLLDLVQLRTDGLVVRVKGTLLAAVQSGVHASSLLTGALEKRVKAADRWHFDLLD